MQQGCLRNCQAVQAKTHSKSAASIPRLSSIAFDMAAANSLLPKKKYVKQRRKGKVVHSLGLMVCKISAGCSSYISSGCILGSFVVHRDAKWCRGLVLLVCGYWCN